MPWPKAVCVPRVSINHAPLGPGSLGRDRSRPRYGREPDVKAESSVTLTLGYFGAVVRPSEGRVCTGWFGCRRHTGKCIQESSSRSVLDRLLRQFAPCSSCIQLGRAPRRAHQKRPWVKGTMSISDTRGRTKGTKQKATAQRNATQD